MKKLLYDICRVALILYLIQVVILVLCWVWPLDVYLFESWRVIVSINSVATPIVLVGVLVSSTPEKEDDVPETKEEKKDRW